MIASFPLDPLHVRALTERHIALWHETPEGLPRWLKRIDLRVQAANERRFGRYVKEITEAVHSGNITSSLITGIVARRGTTGSTDPHVQHMLDRMASTGRVFVHQARAFDSTLTSAQIFQALRNLWIMNSMQVFFGQEIRLTPSIFAYSLLYPYTDGLLDDPRRDGEEKRQFVRDLASRLRGIRPEGIGGRTEVRISRLIGMIEREWPRDHFPDVFESLLAIHHAQEESLSLQGTAIACSPSRLAGVTFAKGGTSVMADGYLLCGTLDEPSRQWTFAYGTFLQLIDDLQDRNEDREHGHMTMFRSATELNEFADEVYRLLQFIPRVLTQFPGSGAEISALRSLIRDACLMLVFEALACDIAFAHSEHGRRLEERAPVRFSSLRRLRKKLNDLQTSKSLNMLEKGTVGKWLFSRDRSPVAA